MKLRVVVADDTPSVLRHLVSLLETEFEVVATAENGELALECIRHYEPDVVVLDLQMPALNGIEVMKEARRLALRESSRCRCEITRRFCPGSWLD